MGKGSDLDVVVIGRCSVDMMPQERGVSLDAVATFTKSLGGSAANVAVACARLGLATRLYSMVGHDPFGRYVLDTLTDLGVDTSGMHYHEQLPTPITFAELMGPDEFPLYFYRQPDAPDFLLTTGLLDQASIVRARVVWVTLTGFAVQPTRSAHQAALGWRVDRGADQWTILDLDYREQLWLSPEAAHRMMHEAAPHVDIMVGNDKEWAIATQDQPVAQVAQGFFDVGVGMLIVKHGPRGVTIITPDGERYHPGFAVEVVSGLGAGDAFGGALCYALLHGLALADAPGGDDRADMTRVDTTQAGATRADGLGATPALDQDGLTLACAAGAYQATQLACAPAMPDLATLLAFGATLLPRTPTRTDSRTESRAPANTQAAPANTQAAPAATHLSQAPGRSEGSLPSHDDKGRS